jgi:hypothetical protein
MTTGLLIPADDTPCTVVTFTHFSEVNTLIGGWFEAIGSLNPHAEVVAYVDEEGLLKGLGRNMRASGLLQRPIVGPALVFGVSTGPDEADVPQVVIDAFVGND